MLVAFHRHLVSAPFLEGQTDESHQASAVDAVSRMKSRLNAGRQVALRTGTALVDTDKVQVLVHGLISNWQEVCELYGVSPGAVTTDAGHPDMAKLLLELYAEGYADVYGDSTDQPATLLGALEGDFAFLLHDEGCGYLLAMRSASGKVQFFWGLDEDTESNMLLSSSRLPGLSPFPPGCAYESQMTEDTPGKCRLMNVTRHTPAGRGVQTVTRVDSHGHLCGAVQLPIFDTHAADALSTCMMFKSKSGRDLTQQAGIDAAADVY